MLSPETPNRFRGAIELQQKRIMVPITEHLSDELVERVTQGAMAAEMRFDYFRPFDADLLAPEMARYAGALPILGTFRSVAHGGKWTAKSSDTSKAIRSVLPYIDAIDTECESQGMADVIDMAHDEGKFVVASWHDLRGTPPKGRMERLLEHVMSRGADCFKIATTAKTDEDIGRTVDFTHEHGDLPIIAVTMGELGVKGRVLLMQNGSLATFAYVGDKGVVTGQRELYDMKAAIGEAA